MRDVAVLALEGVIAFDLAIPCQVFGLAELPDGSRAYDVKVCTPGSITATNGPSAQFTMKTAFRLEDAAGADTVVVPGLATYRDPPSPDVVAFLRDLHARGTRIASVCTGAFVLAAAGLLDGRRATTHWRQAPELSAMFPRTEVDPDTLYVDNGGTVLTSAGLAAGLDMCLYMVGLDHGAAVAADTARSVVVPMVRDGGQAQFITHKTPIDDDAGLGSILSWMQTNLGRPLSLDDIADEANMSVRTLNRRFRDQLGTTPLQWLLLERVERSKQLLETSDLSVERIASEVGFGSAVTLRQHFARRVGVPPHRYRLAFRSRGGVASEGPSADALSAPRT
jgi:transcriptional regulator GlxA family with amidase domain